MKDPWPKEFCGLVVGTNGCEAFGLKLVAFGLNVGAFGLKGVAPTFKDAL